MSDPLISKQGRMNNEPNSRLTATSQAQGTSFDVNAKLGYYCVAFLDLLGQKRAMKAIEEPFRALLDAHHTGSIELRNTSQEHLGMAVRNSIGVIEAFNKSLEYSRNATEESLEAYLQKILPIKRQVVKQALSAQIKCSRLSDGIVLYAPLTPSESNSPGQALQLVLAQCGLLHINQLVAGHPLRGGIEVAPAMEVENSGLHGPALVAAYELEQSAGYPRLVVGPGLRKFASVLDQLGAERSRQEKAITTSISGVVQRMIRQDGDGKHIVDVFGRAFKEAGPPGVTGATLKKCLAFAREQKALFESSVEEDSTKLAKRYAELTRYLESRQHYWR